MDIRTAIQPPTGLGLLGSNLIDASTIYVELAIGLVVVIICLVSIVFWIKAFSRVGKKQELIPYQRSECVLGFIDVVAIFVIWIGSQIAVGIVLAVVVGFQSIKSLPSETTIANGSTDLFAEHGILLLYLSAVTGIAALLLAGSFLAFRYKTTNAFGLRFDHLVKQMGYGATVFVMLFPLVMLIQWLLSMIVEYDHPVLSALADNPTFVSIGGCWTAAVLAAPFLEEFLFRGVFQHWLERLSVSKLSNDQLIIGGANIPPESSIAPNESGTENFVTAELVQSKGDDAPALAAELAQPNGDHAPALAAEALNPYETPQHPGIRPTDAIATNQRRFAYWPIFVSSACFALIHLGQGLAPIPLFILAVGLGYLFRQTGSLIACITVHFLLNFYSMLVFTTIVLLGETP